MKVTIGPYKELDNDKRKIEVVIHDYDTWNMDHTLSHVIVPMLEQLHEEKHGAPYVDVDDCPKDLRPTVVPHDHETDDTHFARWDWALEEMIWAFKEIRDDKPNEPDILDTTTYNKEQHEAYMKRIQKGTTLFGKYYSGLWD